MLLEKILIFMFLNFSCNIHLFLLLKFFITENILHFNKLDFIKCCDKLYLLKYFNL